MQRLSRGGALLAIVIAMAGCASAPPLPTPVATPDLPDARVEVMRAAERHRALALKSEQAKDLVGAVRQWQIVLLLLPDDRQASARLASVRSSMANTVSEDLAAARDAQRRAELDQAQQLWLRVLAYDAYNEEAVTALRELDRLFATRRAAERAARARMEEKQVATRGRTAPRPARTEAGEYDIEQSLELLRAGDAKVALPELRRYATANPRDKAGRERIAVAVHSQAQQLQRQGGDTAAVSLFTDAINLHPSPPRDWVTQLAQLKARLAGQEYEKGVRMMTTDVPAAITHFEAALRLVPDHTQAQLRLERARKMQENLRAIGPTRGRD